MLYYGHSGTLQAGSTSSFTLAASEDVSQEDAEGRYILTISGTGSGQYDTISAYNSSTKVGSPSDNFSTTLGVGTGYVVGTSWRELGIEFWEDRPLAPKPGIPESWSEYNGEIIFERPLDSTAVAGLLDYYMDVDKLDLLSADMGTIYYQWRNIIHWGICYRGWLERGDARTTIAQGNFQRALLDAGNRDKRQRRGRRTMKYRSGGGLPAHGV